MADGSVKGDVRELRQMLADCEKYLKDGETPAQRIERERRDTEAVLHLIAIAEAAQAWTEARGATQMHARLLALREALEGKNG